LKSAIFTVIVLVLTAGCAPWKISKPNIWPFTAEDPPGTPTRIITSWTDTVLYQPNQIPLRGFGGRLIFYEGEKPEAIKVDGTLTVYVFDETNRDPNNVKPDRKYVFTKDQLPSHYSKSKLGHSYSVWIPWDEVGGPQKEISLIARFTPEKGSVVVSEQTKQILPGQTQAMVKYSKSGLLPAAATQIAPAQYPSAKNSSVQAASYVTPLPPVDSRIQDGGQDSRIQDGGQNTVDNSRNIEAATIKLPPQSSLRKSMLTGNAANLVTSIPTTAMPPVNPKYATRTGVINAAGQMVEQNPPAQYPETAAVNTGTTSSNRFAQPVLQPSRFAPGRLPAPNAQPMQPYRDPGQWQPRPSRPTSFPETTPQSANSNGFQQPSVDNWSTQN
jgi:hypothetical protein